nr:superoxide dismutase family protein [uncultured Noviherbaspirillum sp.]
MEPVNSAPRRRRNTWVVLAPAVVSASLAMVATPASAYDVSAEVKLYNAAFQQVGKAKLTERGDGNVAVHIDVRGLTPGFHGFHVHAIGKCTIEDPPTPFTSSGGHFGSGTNVHGEHAGDFPVLLVRSDGTANVRFSTDRFTLEALFDADGSALIIHANRDNYANIPTRYTAAGVAGPDAATLSTGDAGTRVVCGVLERVVKRDKGHDDRDDRDDKDDKGGKDGR